MADKKILSLLKTKENHPLFSFHSGTSSAENVSKRNIKRGDLRKMRDPAIFSSAGFFTFLQG